MSGERPRALHRDPRFWAIVIVLFLGVIHLRRVLIMNFPDFRVFFVAGEHAWKDPLKIYRDSPDRFLYPPAASLFFAPFSWLFSWEVSRLIWYGGLLLILLFLAWGTWANLLALVLLGRAVLINLSYGQVNLLILGLLVLASTKRRDALAGAWLSLASMIKVFPAVQGLQLLCERRWRAIAWATAVFLGLALLPFLFWGPEVAMQVYRDFPASLHDKGVPTYSHNQSLLAFLLRFFGGEPFVLFTQGPVDWTVLVLPKALLKGVAIGVGVALSAWAWVRAGRRRRRLDFVSATGFTILFLSHLVWKPYFILLFPALAQIIEQFLRGERTRRVGWILGLFAAFQYLSAPDMIGHPASTIADAMIVHYWAALLVFAGWLPLKSRS